MPCLPVGSARLALSPRIRARDCASRIGHVARRGTPRKNAQRKQAPGPNAQRKQAPHRTRSASKRLPSERAAQASAPPNAQRQQAPCGAGVRPRPTSRRRTRRCAFPRRRGRRREAHTHGEARSQCAVRAGRHHHIPACVERAGGGAGQVDVRGNRRAVDHDDAPGNQVLVSRLDKLDGGGRIESAPGNRDVYRLAVYRPDPLVRRVCHEVAVVLHAAVRRDRVNRRACAWRDVLVRPHIDDRRRTAAGVANVAIVDESCVSIQIGRDRLRERRVVGRVDARRIRREMVAGHEPGIARDVPGPRVPALHVTVGHRGRCGGSRDLRARVSPDDAVLNHHRGRAAVDAAALAPLHGEGIAGNRTVDDPGRGVGAE